MKGLINMLYFCCISYTVYFNYNDFNTSFQAAKYAGLRSKINAT